MKFLQILIHTPLDEPIETVNGFVRWGDYIIDEKTRLEKLGRTVEIRADGVGRVGLYANQLCIMRGCRKNAEHLRFCNEHRE